MAWRQLEGCSWFGTERARQGGASREVTLPKTTLPSQTTCLETNKNKTFWLKRSRPPLSEDFAKESCKIGFWCSSTGLLWVGDKQIKGRQYGKDKITSKTLMIIIYVIYILVESFHWWAQHVFTDGHSMLASGLIPHLLVAKNDITGWMNCKLHSDCSKCKLCNAKMLFSNVDYYLSLILNDLCVAQSFAQSGMFKCQASASQSLNPLKEFE